MNAPPTIHFGNIPVHQVGDPFPLNAPSPDDHRGHDVAQLADGGFISTWSNDPDDVRAQLFDATGARVGAEIIVNSQDFGRQRSAQVEGLAGGGFVVTWLDEVGDTGTGVDGQFAIKAQIFSAAGAKVGGEILVNSAINGAQYPREVTALANGNFVVVWNDGWQYGSDGSFGVGGATGDSSESAIKAQLFAADGSRIGGEILVNTTTTKDQSNPVVTPLANGGFAVGWDDYSQNYGGGVGWEGRVDVRVQLFDAAGAKAGAELLMEVVRSDLEVRFEYLDSITQLGNGNLLVLWTDYQTGSFYYDPPAKLLGQILTPDGARVGGTFLVHASTGFSPDPLVQVYPGGGFVVAWTEGESPDSERRSNTEAQRFADDGMPIGAEVVVGTEGYQNRASGLAVFANGEIAVMYVNMSMTPGYPVPTATRVQLLDGAMHKLGNSYVVATGVFGGLAFAMPDGAMLMTTGQYSSTGTGQLLSHDFLLPAVASIPLDLRGTIIVGDADAGAGSLTVTLSVPGGILDVGAGTSGAAVAGSGTSSVTITGTLAQIGALLGGTAGSRVDFIAAPGSPPSLDLTVTVNDNGNSDGAPQIATADLTIDLVPPASDQHGGVAADILTGGEGIDLLYGGDGDDILNGFAGNDYMAGGAGNDTFYADTPADVVVEAAGGGLDRVRTSISYILAADAEIEILERAENDSRPLDLTGNDFGQTIIGNNGANILRGRGGDDILVGEDGDDYLVGGTGNDIMRGGPGNDTFYVDSAGDIVEGGEGANRVATTTSYVLLSSAGVQRLEAVTPSATDAMDLTGADHSETIAGNNAANILRGNGGNDTLIGYGGDDVLVGGTGSDRMEGGAGNDTYYVDSGTVAGGTADLVVEATGAGVDRIATSVSYALDGLADVEIFEVVNLGSTNAINLTGNQFGQTIVGNDGANILNGNGGDDVLIGARGNDFLGGGTGIDAMYGGLDADVYYVDAAGDIVVEAVGEGTDRVAASASYALMASAEIELIEAITPGATAAMDLAGNEFGQTINGNNGANILRGNGGDDNLSGYGGDDYLVGGAGNDIMAGSLGNDTYYVDAAGDVVSEAAGEGSDRVAAAASYALAAGAEIETLEAVNLTATDAIDLTGNAGVNAITGNNGANRLDGKSGNDVLTGAGGADTFAFTTAPGAGNVDRIVDFAQGTDKIALDDAVFGALGAGAFAFGTQAQEADDRIVYNTATGELFFDADGNGAGAAVLFATLDGHPALTAGDFVVI